MALKRILSIVLTLYLCLLLIPAQVFAADTDSSTTAVEVTVDSTAKGATSLSAPVVTVQNVTSTGKNQAVLEQGKRRNQV